MPSKYIRKPRLSLEDRFWAKVQKTDGCWIWAAYRNRDGYGMFGFGGSPERAHRVAWILTKGAIPNGLSVLHRCDNRACVNPDHLFLGTHQDNLRDMFVKGRNAAFPSGESHCKAAFTADQIRAIRAEYVPRKVSYRKLAEKYGVHQETIARIVRREFWRDVG